MNYSVLYILVNKIIHCRAVRRYTKRCQSAQSNQANLFSPWNILPFQKVPAFASGNALLSLFTSTLSIIHLIEIKVTGY